MKTEIIDAMLAAYTAATVQLPNADPEDLRAGDSDLEGKTLPLTMYETVYTYHDDSDVIVKGEVKEIRVTRFGVDSTVGATAPSISFISWDGHKARGSADLFYERKEWAQAEIDFHLATANREQANKDLNALVRAHLPMILDEARR